MDTRLAVRDEVEQPPDRARDDGTPVRHRLGADDAEALAERRHRYDRCPVVEPLELFVWDETPRARQLVAQRPVAHDDERDAVRRLDELEHAFLT
jgi:hypothetical protein